MQKNLSPNHTNAKEFIAKLFNTLIQIYMTQKKKRMTKKEKPTYTFATSYKEKKINKQMQQESC